LALLVWTATPTEISGIMPLTEAQRAFVTSPKARNNAATNVGIRKKIVWFINGSKWLQSVWTCPPATGYNQSVHLLTNHRQSRGSEMTFKGRKGNPA